MSKPKLDSMCYTSNGSNYSIWSKCCFPSKTSRWSKSWQSSSLYQASIERQKTNWNGRTNQNIVFPFYTIQLAQLVQRYGALQIYEDNLLKADSRLLKYNNHTKVPSVDVPRATSKELANSTRLHPDMLMELEMMLFSMRESDHTSTTHNKSRHYKSVFQRISFNLFSRIHAVTSSMVIRHYLPHRRSAISIYSVLFINKRIVHSHRCSRLSCKGVTRSKKVLRVFCMF